MDFGEATVLTAPGGTYASERTTRRRATRHVERRDVVEEHANAEADGGYKDGRRRTGLRLTFRGGMPQSVWGRLVATCAFISILCVGWAAAEMVRRMVLHDERFVLTSSSSILTEGNHHLSRTELLEVLGDDIERNILRVPLKERRAEVERIPLD